MDFEDGVDRRSALKAAAWSVPVVVVAMSTPAAAASMAVAVVATMVRRDEDFGFLTVTVTNASTGLGISGLTVALDMLFGGTWYSPYRDMYQPTDNNGQSSMDVLWSGAFEGYRAHVAMDGVQYTSNPVP